VLLVASAVKKCIDLSRIDIKPHNGKTRLAEANQQGESNIAEPDNAYLSFFSLNLA